MLLLLVMASLIAVPTIILAGDYDWFRDFNIQAQSDASGFRAQLATRFKIGELQIETVLGNVDHPADAYMVFRLGEMSGRPVQYVLDQYRSGKNTGWGALAKSLGIKPGSQEFHALKNGHDLYGGGYGRDDNESNKGKKEKKNKGKGKSGKH
jgi:hypothetical protein